MIERFKFYLDQDLARKELPDMAEARSLIEKACQRMKFIKSLDINEKSSTFIFEDIYECIREAAQSLMSLAGYKPFSHEAVISFIKEFHKFSGYEIESFNRYRILRNNCVYKASRASPETCKEAMRFLDLFLPKLRSEFEKKSDEK